MTGGRKTGIVENELNDIGHEKGCECFDCFPEAHDKSERRWNPQQVEILKDAAEGTGDTVVIARAGTGKTTTMLEAAKCFPAGCSIVYLAFNSRIKEEVSRKAPQGIDVRTLHALGRGALFLVAKGKGKQLPEPDGDKMRKLIDRTWETIPSVVRTALVSSTSFAKNTLAKTVEEIESIVYRLDLDIGTDPSNPNYRAALVKFCGATLRLMDLSMQSFMDRLEYDFDDMIWIPASQGLRVKQFDRVIVDEGQDLNACQHKLARMARRAGGRIIMVGDDCQAIYAWRGALEDGLSSFAKELNAKILRLPVTYRCGQKIVTLAKTAVADYEAAPSNAEGTIDNANTAKMVRDAQPGDAILSRINAPLIKLCLDLLKSGKRARVVGRDVGKQLLSLINAAEKADVSVLGGSVPSLVKWLDAWSLAECERILSRNPPGDTEPTTDRVECLMALSEGAGSIREIKEKIADLFTEEPGRTEIVLSSTHKAKGLEWDTVWMLADTYRKAKSNEERNLWYVAVTRAIARLVMVSDSYSEPEIVAALPAPAIELPAVVAPEKVKKTRKTRAKKGFEPSKKSPLWAPLMPA